jgi:hypothetical protein
MSIQTSVQTVTRTRKKVARAQQKPYDNALKGLFTLHTREMLSFAAGVKVEEVKELSGEALKPPLHLDRVYLVRCKSRSYVVHIELETRGNTEMGYRMLEYFGILLRKYQEPIIPTVIYPFRTSIPNPQMCVTDDDGNAIAAFHYRAIKLWEIEASDFIRNWPPGLYTLLPALKNVDYSMLAQALDTWKTLYAEKNDALEKQLLWFDVFLTRSDTVLEEDRRKIMQKREDFNNLLDQGFYVQKKLAEGEEIGIRKGEEIGILTGAVATLQRTILAMVQVHTPALTELAQSKVNNCAELSKLDELFNNLLHASDEQTARSILQDL